MTDIPKITVQLFHIQGPSKGNVQEFSESRITIGRHPSCDVHFPKDLKIISRKHAEIVREGNRFKIIDHSTNGTFVNGKRIKDAFLKNGDVLLFTQNGPKISFLSKIEEGKIKTPSIRERPSESFGQKGDSLQTSSKPVNRPVTTHPEPSMPEVKISLIIQYGPTLQTFERLPIKVGKHPSCNFKITDNPLINDFQAEINYKDNNFWIKDLTGQGVVFINRKPIVDEVVLLPDYELSLSPQGPYFRFMGEGRLAEIQIPTDDVPLETDNQAEKPGEISSDDKDSKKGFMSFLEKFIK